MAMAATAPTRRHQFLRTCCPPVPAVTTGHPCPPAVDESDEPSHGTVARPRGPGASNAPAAGRRSPVTVRGTVPVSVGPAPPRRRRGHPRGSPARGASWHVTGGRAGGVDGAVTVVHRMYKGEHSPRWNG